MTKEEALKTWLPIISMSIDNIPELEEAFDMAVKALEQEPVFDKLRVEIDLETRVQVKHSTNTDAVIDAVLEVIDKYKAKCEG